LTEVGFGIGVSGPQFSAMQKIFLGTGRSAWLAGVGLSYAIGSDDFPDDTLWLNVDLAGVELRTARGLLLSLAGGATTALAGGRYRGLFDCSTPYCHSAVGEIWPQGRVGLGFWF